MLRRHCTPFTLPLLPFLSLLSVLFFHAMAFAQWSAEGVPIAVGDVGGVGRWQVFPDHEGGFYSVYGSSMVGCRVQKYDSSGVALWGPYGLRMFPDSLDYGAGFTGADTTGDGGVVVAFSNYDIHPETGVDVYAQRFSPDGERLFGPTGAVLCQAPGQQVDDESAWEQTAGDRHGGIWAVMLTDVNGPTLVNGVNGDGTQKRAEDYRVANADLEIGSRCGFGTDIQGGFVVAWSDPTAPDPVQRLKRVWLDVYGNELAPPLVIGQRDFDGFWSIDVLGLQDSSVFYSITSDYQREYANHSLEWGLNLEYHSLAINNGKPGNAVLTAGNNILRYFTGQNGGYLYWLHPNGTPVLSQALTHVDTTRILSHNFRTLLLPNRDSTCVYSASPWYRPEVDYDRVVIRKWTNNGSNAWHGPGTLFQGPEGISYLNGARLSDGSVVIAIRTNGAPYIYRLMKFYPDGSVAGVENAVAEPPHRATPTGFMLEAVYPNPFNGTVRFALNIHHAGAYTLTLYNIRGQQVQQHTYSFVPGKETVSFSLDSDLASGIYFARWNGGESKTTLSKLMYLR